jgi:hypothetical protein
MRHAQQRAPPTDNEWSSAALTTPVMKVRTPPFLKSSSQHRCVIRVFYLIQSLTHDRQLDPVQKGALELGVSPRLLLKDPPDLYTSPTLTAWSASAGGEKSETAPLRYAGKDGRPRYPPLISPDAGTRVHYDRAFASQH